MQIVNYDGYLTDEQIILTVRMTDGIYKIKGMIEHLNSLRIESNLDLEPILISELSILDKEIRKVMAKHSKAEDHLKTVLFESAGNENTYKNRLQSI